MGEFASGKWIIGLGIYFFIFFLFTLSIVNGLESQGISTTIQFDDPGYQTQGSQNAANNSAYTFNGSASGNIDYTRPSESYSSFKSTLAIMTGISSSKVDIGMPQTYRFIMVFFLFWIPMTMLLWSIYMAIPFLH